MKYRLKMSRVGQVMQMCRWQRFFCLVLLNIFHNSLFILCSSLIIYRSINCTFYSCSLLLVMLFVEKLLSDI